MQKSEDSIEAEEMKDLVPVESEHKNKDLTEDDQQEGSRLPSLMTFDVRDKKSNFQTSCYVRRDIIATSAAAIISQQSSMDSRLGANMHQSRNMKRQNGDDAPFGIKNSTLLQDSLNSVISKQLCTSSAKPAGLTNIQNDNQSKSKPKLEDLEIFD